MAHAGQVTLGTAGEFRPETLRGTEGFFRVGQDGDGRWWLADAAGRPFFCKAVQGVRASAPAATGVPLAPDPATRLRAWGFDAVGTGGDGAGREDGLAFMAAVDFCRAGAVIVAPCARLPDVFDPDWPRVAAARAAEVCAPLADNRALIGWVTDDEAAWAQPRADGRASLLQLCLSLEPSFAAYHAAWEFTLALHGGRIEAVARAWGVALANKEVVRGLTRTEAGLRTRGYLRDDARWTREFARRYFTTAAAAIRAADANHLVLGCRFIGPVGAAVLAECVYPAVDVAMPDRSEWSLAGAGPVLAGNFFWPDEREEIPGAAASRRTWPRLTAVERQLKRGRATLKRLTAHPTAVGYVWGQWQDEPTEQPPFARGLVHVNGAEAREHAELLAAFNARAEALRRAAKPGRG